MKGQLCRTCGTDNPAKFDPLSKKECRACKAGRRARRVAPVQPRAPDRAPRANAKKNPEHLAWIRTLCCAVYLCGNRNMHAHHVRAGTGGGTGMKPNDLYCVPLCDEHHREGHDHGWQTFERKYRIVLRAEAERLAKMSPATPGGANIKNVRAE